MTSFKRWLGAGAIVLVALALVACPAMVPKATGSIPAMSFAHDDMTARTVALGSFFADDDNATYKAESSKPAVATVSVKDATLTVTPKGAGTTTVTVTATSSTGRDSATQTFAVTVASPPTPPPPPANNAPEMRTIVNVSLDVGASTPVDLADYASDADGDTLVYGAQSLNPAVATVTPSGLAIPGSVITITGVSGGEAQIAVGVTDGKSAPVTRTFLAVVTAPEPDNRAPVLLTSNLIPHVVYSDFRIGATMDYDLSMHFQDPDADTLMYGAKSANPMVASITGDANTGMFTLTAVGKGDTTVTVMATDPDGASAQQTFKVGVGSKAPTLVNVSNVVALVLQDGMTMQTLDLMAYFNDPEGDDLTFAIADAGDTSIATVTEPDAMDMITITAVAMGKTMIEVTAADSDNDPVSLMLDVRVSDRPNRAPVVEMVIDDQDLMLDVSPMKTIDVMGNFSDPDGDTLMYTVASDMPNVVATADGSMITIEANAIGDAEVTVTASDGMYSVDAVFTVSVSAPAAPTWKKEIPDVTLEHDDVTQTFMLEEYFDGATEYHAMSDDLTVVTADVDDAQTTLTLTRAGAGSTIVEVTPSNSGGDGPTQTITVTVEAARQAPTEKADMMLKDIRLEVAGTTTKAYNLDDYFEDPDGSAALTYSTMTGTPATVAVYETAETAPTDLDAIPDTVAGAMVTLAARVAGTATITVTVTDSDGLVTTRTFDVLVVANNNAPAGGSGGSPPDLPNYTAANRLKMGDEPKKAIDDAAINVHFADADLTTVPNGDLLTFTARYVATGGGLAGADLADDDIVATATIMPDTWDGDLGGTDKFTVTVTPEKAGGPHDILIVATDIAGEQFARVISVQVNHAPMAKGAVASGSSDEPGTLTKLSDSYDDLGMSSGFQTVTGITNPHQVVLVADDSGYFSDEDNATADLSCRFNTTGDAIFATGFPQWATATTRRQLNLATNATTAFAAQGTASIEVWCVDPSGERSDSDTLTITVSSSGSIH